LRPARETCEECHWPQKFYARKLRLERHYLNDKTNTEWDIRLVMKIGAVHEALGLQEGIHWHINPEIKIEYIAADTRRQVIPWVRYINKSSKDTTIYLDQDNPLDETRITDENIRTMDCMDCHNRPSHSYQPPAFFVNNALTSGNIPKSLPEIKSIAMEICSQNFTTKDSAMRYIEETLSDYYQEPEYAEEVIQAIAGLQDAYRRNIFPYMQVKWDAYPNNIGHLEFDGCFRCHNDTHINSEETVISKDCNLCHEIVEQGTTDALQSTTIGQALAFEHPVDIDDAWQEGLCTDCHTGLNP
jgi:hypothetical protein